MNTYTRDGRTVTCEAGGAVERRMVRRGWTLEDAPKPDEGNQDGEPDADG